VVLPGEVIIPEKVEKTAKLINTSIKGIIDNGYENVDIPTYQRHIGYN
jgi:hypothetical protein